MRRLISLIVISASVIFTASPAISSTYDLPQSSATFNDDVRQIAYDGDILYVGGKFTQAQDTDGTHKERGHVASVDTTTGALTDFNPVVEGLVQDVATDDTYFYIAGEFTKIDGQYHPRAARFLLSTGELDTTWDPRPSARVFSIEPAEDRVYLGGRFASVGGQYQPSLAAVKSSDGSLIAEFAPIVSGGAVRDIVYTGDHLYIAGAFDEVEGSDDYQKLADVDPINGQLNYEFQTGARVLIRQIAVEGNTIYAAMDGRGGEVRAYDIWGNTLWYVPVDGGVQAVTVYGDRVIGGGHFEEVCVTNRSGPMGECVDGTLTGRRKLFASDKNGNLLDWHPDADSAIGVWALQTHPEGKNFAAGGSFHTFGYGEMPQQGLAIFK